jgi:hypothetical protein
MRDSTSDIFRESLQELSELTQYEGGTDGNEGRIASLIATCTQRVEVVRSIAVRDDNKDLMNKVSRWLIDLFSATQVIKSDGFYQRHGKMLGSASNRGLEAQSSRVLFLGQQGERS